MSCDYLVCSFRGASGVRRIGFLRERLVVLCSCFAGAGFSRFALTWLNLCKARYYLQVW